MNLKLIVGDNRGIYLLGTSKYCITVCFCRVPCNFPNNSMSFNICDDIRPYVCRKPANRMVKLTKVQNKHKIADVILATFTFIARGSSSASGRVRAFKYL